MSTNPERLKRYPTRPRVAQEASRVARCLSIAMVLNQQPMTRAEIAEQFGVSERRITDDLRVLRAAGVIISHQRPEGYRVWLEESMRRR